MPSGKRTICALCLLIVGFVSPARAQTYSLSGKVTDTAAHAVPSAKVTAKSVAGGHVFKAETNADGLYTIPDLAGGDYELTATAGELKAQPVKITLAAAQTTDLTVAPAPRRKSAKTRSQHKPR